MKLRSWFGEPLLHFLLAGGAVFAVLQWLAPDDPGGLTIRLGEDALIDHLQERAQLYDRENFARLLDGMSEAERAELARDAATSEALWREGQALGLAQADPLVRARVIQQMRQILMEEAAADVELDENQFRQFYEANRDRYAAGAQVSFGHVFLSGEARSGPAAAKAAAQRVLEQLHAGNVSLADAGNFGDRFLYQRNYSASGEQEIASQFGAGFAGALMQLDVSPRWQGPLQSEHGWHLVLVRQKSPARIPDYASIAGQVQQDALAEERSRRAEQALDRLMDRYEVVEE